MTEFASAPSLPTIVSCPKLPRGTRGYQYYAGYSPSFVYDILSRWPRHAFALDPWNGSGTTTSGAAKLGLNFLGVDLNPAMVVVARAGLLLKEDISAINRQAHKLRALRSTGAPLNTDDPLLEWLNRSSVARVRALQTMLTGSTRFTAPAIAAMSAVKAYWLTLLFTTVKRATRAWRSTNPTWVKSRGQLPPAKLFWRQMVGELYRESKCLTPIPTQPTTQSRVALGTSTNLSGYGITPDIVLGSPPYCTRLDYAVATRIELSVLGMTSTEQLELRRTLMGTTTVPPVLANPTCHIGATASHTLHKVAHHPSKASHSYYWKWLAQYFTEYGKSLSQVAEVTSPTGTIGLVVQDSYYKELNVNLPKITTEILTANGWNLYRAYAFTPRRSLAQINPRAIAYRNRARPQEHALFFRSE